MLGNKKKEVLVDCQLCHLPFPGSLINHLIIEEGQVQSCPICALDIIRKLHKLPAFIFKKRDNIRMLGEAVTYNRNRKPGYNTENPEQNKV